MANKIGIGVLGWAHGHVGTYASQIKGFRGRGAGHGLGP